MSLRRRLGAGAVLLLVVIAGVPQLRDYVLRSAGALLVVHAPVPSRADVILLSMDAGDAGVLEAADLVHRGVAPRVALFANLPTKAEAEFARRGLPYETEAMRSVRLLVVLGVQKAEVIPQHSSGSEQMTQIIRTWCADERIAAAVLISQPHHARRLTRLMHRVMDGSHTSVVVHDTSYSDFRADDWWQRKDTLRAGVIELQKLLLDAVLHPI